MLNRSFHRQTYMKDVNLQKHKEPRDMPWADTDGHGSLCNLFAYLFHNLSYNLRVTLLVLSFLETAWI